MAWYRIAENVLDAIADAINAKTGGTSPMTPVEMVLEIQSIPTGGGTDRLKTAEVTLTQDYASPFASTAITLFRAAVNDAQNIVFQLIDAGTYQFVDSDAVLAKGCRIYVENAPLEVRNATIAVYRHYRGNEMQGPYDLNTGCFGMTGTTYRVWGWNT